MVARALLRGKAQAALQLWESINQECQDLSEELDYELQRIAQGKHPWSDPV